MESNDVLRQRNVNSPKEDHQTPAELGTNDKFGYKRRIGLLGGVSFIAGSMIGSGIFISPKGVALEMGSVGGSLVIWAVGGVIAMLSAICYTELGTMIHESGGDYTYMRVGLGDGIAFVYAWQVIFAIRPAAGAVSSLTCAQYLLTPLFNDDCGEAPAVTVKCLAMAVICLVTFVNCRSVNAATRVQIIFMFAKVTALLIIITGGIARLAQGYTDNFQDSFVGTTTNPGKIGVAIYNCLWSYDAWSALNALVEEVVNVRRTLPLSIVIVVPLVTVLYLLTNISYFTVMTVDQLIASPAVAVVKAAGIYFTWAQTVIPNLAWIIPISVAFSTFGGLNASIFTAGRFNRAASTHGHMIEILSMINVHSYTPVPGILFNAFLGCIFIFFGSVLSLINFLSFASWIFNAFVMVSLIVMRFTKSNAKRPIKVPIILPFMVLIIAIFLVFVPLIADPKIQYLYASLFIIGGLVLYVPFVYFKIQPAFMDYITRSNQLYWQVCPARIHDEFEYTGEMTTNVAESDSPSLESCQL